MKIELKVIGKELFSFLSGNASSFPKTFRSNAVDWHISYVSTDLDPKSFLCFTDRPSVMLVEAQDLALADKVQLMEGNICEYIKNNTELPLVRAPIIFVFQSTVCLQRAVVIPECVADWVFIPFEISELVRRIFVCLRRQKFLKIKLQCGALTLEQESQTVSYDGKTLHLSPLEFILAESFISQMGVVIPNSDLISLFKSKGNSSEINNIRVAIFQIRLKLAVLTKSRFLLISVYKKGYCLRQRPFHIAHLGGAEEAGGAPSENIPQKHSKIDSGDLALTCLVK